jgi:hypothetical protein
MVSIICTLCAALALVSQTDASPMMGTKKRASVAKQLMRRGRREKGAAGGGNETSATTATLNQLSSNADQLQDRFSLTEFFAAVGWDITTMPSCASLARWDDKQCKRCAAKCRGSYNNCADQRARRHIQEVCYQKTICDGLRKDNTAADSICAGDDIASEPCGQKEKILVQGYFQSIPGCQSIDMAPILSKDTYENMCLRQLENNLRANADLDQGDCATRCGKTFSSESTKGSSALELDLGGGRKVKQLDESAHDKPAG